MEQQTNKCVVCGKPTPSKEAKFCCLSHKIRYDCSMMVRASRFGSVRKDDGGTK